jgi:hypothetical protein
MKKQFGLVFWFHLFVTALSWFAPFLFWWLPVVIVYGLVQIQFWVFGRCLMNEQHALSDADDTTFYSHLFDIFNLKPNKAKLKFFIRKMLYPILIAVTIIWQVVLGYKSLIF